MTRKQSEILMVLV